MKHTHSAPHAAGTHLTPAPSAKGQHLAHLMLAVAQAMAAIQAGQSWRQATADTPNGLRPGVQALGFSVLRHWGRATALRQILAKLPPPPLADALLCSALALLAQKKPPYAAYVLLNETVEAAKNHPDSQHQAGFVNACLRRFLREQAALMQRTDALVSARWNFPDWWVRRMQQERSDWQHILRTSNHSAALQLRVNVAQTTPAAYAEVLAQAGVTATALGPVGLELAQHGDVAQLPGYAQGWFSVQDAAAQLAAPLLLADWPAPKGQPLRVLDACAAPGGKTAHLLELAQAQGRELAVTAVELDASRSERIAENLSRLQLPSVELVVADALDFARTAQAEGRQFDAILLDAPCSASGIVRRHPDVRWLRRESDIAKLAKVQQQLLAACWGLLAQGGRLLYCVCSVFQAEGEGVVQAFQARNTNAHALAAPGHLFPQSGDLASGIGDNQASDSPFAWINTVSHDGFYYALLEKRTQSAAVAPAAAAVGVELSATGRPVLRATGARAGSGEKRRRGPRLRP